MIYIKKWLEYYNQVFKPENNQVDFFDNLSKGFSAPVKYLSVECGTAEVSLKLAERGYDVSVTDSYKEFTDALSQAQENNDHKISVYNLNPIDIVRFFRKETFNIIYCTNHRLIFIKDKASIQKLMFDSRMMLSDGGYLVLDLINFSKYDFSSPRIDISPKKTDSAELYSYILKDSDTMKYRINQQVVTKDGKSVEVVKDEEITPISFETFKSFANEVKFSSIQFYGDYLGNPLSEDSDRIICVLKK